MDTLQASPRITPQAVRLRLVLIFALGVLAFAGLLLVPPLPQPLAYHNFADQRTLLNIPHALNVLSNLPFVIFGVMGLRFLLGAEATRPGGPFLEAWERWGYLVLFAFVTLTGFGSMYYHASPSND